MPEAPIVRNLEEATRHNPSNPALVEVPGKYVGAVVGLLGMFQRPSQDHVGFRIEALRKFDSKGVVVTNIGPGSRSAKTGMARGDVLLTYDGIQLGGSEKLRDLTRRTHHTKQVKIKAVRGKEEVLFEVHGGTLGITVRRLT